MARVPLKGPDAWVERAMLDASSARLALSLPGKSKGRRALSRAAVEQARREAEDMRAARDFRRATALHLVAVWAWCHEQTYEVAPAMTLKDWGIAALAAGQLVARAFDGKVERAIPFIQWTWADEQKLRAWKRERGVTCVPLGWRRQFSAQHVVRWRANGGG